jgi:hypothetical protein
LVDVTEVATEIQPFFHQEVIEHFQDRPIFGVWLPARLVFIHRSAQGKYGFTLVM